MKNLSEGEALTCLQRTKAAYQSHIKRIYEPQAQDCKTCPTAGVCCTDAHFVNVHITRLEAVAIRETLARTPRLNRKEQQAIYRRAGETATRYGLRASGDTHEQTYSCPLFEVGVGCLVHRRAKPAPCVQHACYQDWEDMPPVALQWRTERGVERLNKQVYGLAWAWLPIPVWLSLVDPESNGADLARLIRVWSARDLNREQHRGQDLGRADHRGALSYARRRRSLPVLR